MASKKIIIKDAEVWAYNGELSDPTKIDWEKGNVTGVGATPPKHSDHNYDWNRADTNIQAILQEGITQYYSSEIYPKHGLVMWTDGSIYQSQVDNNEGNSVINPSFWLPYVNPAQYGVGSVLERADGKTPNELGYPGEWTAIESNVGTVTCAPDDAGIGNISGKWEQDVPVPLHSHEIDDPGHDHSDERFGQWRDGTGGARENYCTGVSSDKRTSTEQTGISIKDAGDANAKINVQGRVIKLVKWIRTK